MKALRKIKEIKRYYRVGRAYSEDPEHARAHEALLNEHAKKPLRSDVINYLLNKTSSRQKKYLEIGVRRVSDNFNLIEASEKYGVDPGVEGSENAADFKITSDEFFAGLQAGDILAPDKKFDVIFIDGLHTATQAGLDIQNALEFIEQDGFIVVHDCNPPTEYHARETFSYQYSPARGQWNGTVWKAVYRARLNEQISVAVVDSDFGIGVISKLKYFPHLRLDFNPYLEFAVFANDRKSSLNLISFDQLQSALGVSVKWESM